MDALDVAILAEVVKDPRATYGAIGEHVQLSGNAVKARVARLESAGVLRGFVALPDPALLGRRQGALVFTAVEDLDDREAEILHNLPDVPGVLFVDVSIDHAVYVWTLHEDDHDAERIERAAISLIGKPPTVRYSTDAKTSRDDMTAPDWRILRALAPDARQSLKTLGQRSGLSFKTLKRRMDRLVDSHAFRVEPVLSGTHVQGGASFRLVLEPATGTTRAQLRTLLPVDALITSPPDGPLVVAELRRDTLHDAQSLARSLRASPAIARAFLQISTRRRFAGWLDEAIAHRASITEQAPTARVPIPLPRGR